MLADDCWVCTARAVQPQSNAKLRAKVVAAHQQINSSTDQCTAVGHASHNQCTCILYIKNHLLPTTCTLSAAARRKSRTTSQLSTSPMKCISHHNRLSVAEPTCKPPHALMSWHHLKPITHHPNLTCNSLLHLQQTSSGTNQSPPHVLHAQAAPAKPCRQYQTCKTPVTPAISRML